MGFDVGGIKGMNHLEKYEQCFCEVFSLKPGFEGSTVQLNNTPDWDSVGHMELITALEDAFDIMFDTEDILKLTTYLEGIEILKKYGIEI